MNRENAFEELFEILPDATLVLNENSVVHYANIAAEALLGTGRSKLLGKPISHIIDAADLMLEVRRSTHTRTAMLLPAVSVRSKVAPLPTHTQRGVRLLPFGNHQLLVLFGECQPKHREALDELREDVQYSAGLMAAMLAHEINNPLSGIRGAAQLLGEEASAENQPLAALICKEVDRIHSVLDRVEWFADRSDLPLATLNIHEALRHARQVAEHGFGRGITFVERYDPSLPNLLTHRDSVVHILLNLIKNACEALQEHEQPVVTLKTSALHGSAGGLQLAVDVQDNGSGVPQALRDHLFTPLISNQRSGRGLGLAICRKLAADIHATLRLHDDGKTSGACFRLCLPISKSGETNR